MSKKLTRDEKIKWLDDHNCINSQEYQRRQVRNLKFTCVDCKVNYKKSYAGRKEQVERGIHTCPKCSHNNRAKKQKLTPQQLKNLKEWNCTNIHEYEGFYIDNLEFPCIECNTTYKMSYGNRKNQVEKNCLHTCQKCSTKNSGKKRSLTPHQLKKLEEWNCINVHDYRGSDVPNLKFTCVECKLIYKKSYAGRKNQAEKFGLHTCKRCSSKNRAKKLKLTPQQLKNLKEWNCTNIHEYEGRNVSNLDFPCIECNTTYKVSYVYRKNQVEKFGVHTCPKCSKKNSGLTRRIDYTQRLIDANCINPHDFVNAKEPNLNFKCSIHKCSNIIENRSLQDVEFGHTRCKKCAKSINYKELEIINILKSYNITNIKHGDKKTIRRKENNQPLELDIYLPDYNLAIEFHGSRFHSVWYKHSKNSEIVDKPLLKTLHNEKYKLCKDQGIRLIQIHEHEWNTPKIKEKLINLIIHTLNLTTKKKLYARKCYVKKISNQEANEFLDKHHIQGGSKQGTYNLGLFYHNENSLLPTLVAVSAFVQSSLIKRHKGKHELIRHATHNDYQVIGSLGKLVKHYTKNVHDKIYTFCDVSKFNGHSYIKAGFKETYFSDPQYFYVHDNKQVHKRNFQRQKLAKKFPEFEFKTYGESSMLKELINEGYRIYKIYDAGKICFEI